MELTIKGASVSSTTSQLQRMSMLIWGSAGCGKTTLAATAPGGKLLINFDPDGPASLGNRDDVFVVDMSADRASCVERLKKENPEVSINGTNVLLKQLLDDNPSIETVIVDSVTTLGQMCLAHAVTQPVVQGSKGNSGASIEFPTLAGYAFRNSFMKQIIMTLLRVTSLCKRNIIFIGHEDVPEKNDQGVVMYISIMLGGKLQEEVPLQISEVWAMRDTGTEKRIAVRPTGMRKPMKTRMFKSTGASEFVWKYDADNKTGDGIVNWYNTWKANNFNKINLPK